MTLVSLPGSVLAYVISVSAVAGLVIGSFLNVVIHRVPAGVSLLGRSRCPSCDAPVRPWQNIPLISWIALRGRCAACRARISVRYPLVELGTAVAFAAVAWWWAGHQELGGEHVGFTVPEGAGGVVTAVVDGDPWAGPIVAQALLLVALLWFAAASIALTLIDLGVRRLPTGIVRIGQLAVLVLLVLACLLGADWWALIRGVLGMVLLYVFYALLRFARPGGMGGGDVRLAALVGLVLGWLGAPAFVVGAFAAFLLGGVVGVLLILFRGATGRTAVPFGPWMIAGAWLGAVVGPPVSQWYLGLLG